MIFFPTGLLLQSIWTQTRSRRHARRFTSNKAAGLCDAVARCPSVCLPIFPSACHVLVCACLSVKKITQNVADRFRR